MLEESDDFNAHSIKKIDEVKQMLQQSANSYRSLRNQDKSTDKKVRFSAEAGPDTILKETEQLMKDTQFEEDSIHNLNLNNLNNLNNIKSINKETGLEKDKSRNNVEYIDSTQIDSLKNKTKNEDFNKVTSIFNYFEHNNDVTQDDDIEMEFNILEKNLTGNSFNKNN